MKMSIIVIILIVFAFATVLTDGKRERELHITSLDIQFDKTDATFTINYDFDKFSRMYFLVLGTKTLEPKVRDILQDFEYEIIKIDPDKAIIRVKNISILHKGYYLHNSHRLGDTIDTVYMSDPSTTDIRKYSNVNATPNYFYRSE